MSQHIASIFKQRPPEYQGREGVQKSVLTRPGSLRPHLLWLRVARRNPEMTVAHVRPEKVSLFCLVSQARSAQVLPGTPLS